MEQLVLALCIVLIIVATFLLMSPTVKHNTLTKIGAATIITAAIAGGLLYSGRYITGGGKKPDNIQLIKERKIYSQYGEDGIIQSIFNNVGTTNKYYVDICISSLYESNVKNLRLNDGWSGLSLGVNWKYELPEHNYKVDRVTTGNIMQTMALNNIVTDFDLLSINIGANDYDLWKTICCGKNNTKKYRPRVVLIQCTTMKPPVDVHTENIEVFTKRIHSLYYSASLSALVRLGRQMGYTLVYVGINGNIAFFVRTDVLLKYRSKFSNDIGDSNKLYKPPLYFGPMPTGGIDNPPFDMHWIENDYDVRDIFNRVVIFGKREDCLIMIKLKRMIEFVDCHPVIYYEDENPPYEICRISIILCGVSPPKHFAAFSFKMEPKNTDLYYLFSVNIYQLQFNNPSVVIKESKDIGFIEFVEFIKFPTTLGVRYKLSECEKYLIDANEHVVSEQKYSGGKYSGDKNYETEYKLLIANNDSVIQNSLKRHTLYDKEVTAAGSPYCRRPELSGQSVVYDVGGNIGCIGIPLSRASDIVIAFEPFDRNFVLYEENIRKNRTYNVLVINAAVGNADMPEVSLSSHIEITPSQDDTEIDDESRKLLITNESPFNFGAIRLGVGGQLVPMVKLDTITSQLSPTDYISFMKLDIEGAEALGFAGGQQTMKQHMPVIVYENNGRRVDNEMLEGIKSDTDVGQSSLSILKEIGYKDIYELRREDYLLIPENRVPAYIDSVIKYVPVKKLTDFTLNELTGMTLHKLKSIYG